MALCNHLGHTLFPDCGRNGHLSRAISDYIERRPLGQMLL